MYGLFNTRAFTVASIISGAQHKISYPIFGQKYVSCLVTTQEIFNDLCSIPSMLWNDLYYMIGLSNVLSLVIGLSSELRAWS